MADNFLVRLGKLRFGDFLLLEPCAARQVLADPEACADLALALNNAPDVELHFRRSSGMGPMSPMGHIPALPEIHAARERLVRRFALPLLKHKAPPLYDALPWHDWDFSIVAGRFKLWQTRLLLAGEGTTTLISRLPRTAGIHVLEPLKLLRDYIEKKARLDNIRRLRILPVPDSLLTASLSSIPLPDASADLAIIGSLPSPLTGEGQGEGETGILPELCRVSASILLVENCPLSPPLDESMLLSHGFTQDMVRVRSLGLRRCWWRRR